MLSSHHGKLASAPTISSSETSDDACISENDKYTPKMVMNAVDNTSASPNNLTTNDIGKMEGLPMNQHPNVVSNMDTFLLSVKPPDPLFAVRLQRKNSFINADLQIPITSADQNALPNTPNYPVVHPTESNLQQQLSSPLTLSSLDQKYLPLRIAMTGRIGDDNLNSSECNMPPGNCIITMGLPSRASIANAIMFPPSSAGMVKSDTTHTISSVNSRLLGDSGRAGNPNSPKPKALQRRRSSLFNVNRRHSLPNNMYGTMTSPSNTSLNLTTQKAIIGNNAPTTPSAAMNNGSYLPTPTGSDSSHLTDLSVQILFTMPGFVPPTPIDSSKYTSQTHPFDLVPTAGSTDAGVSGDMAGISAIPVPMSTATKSATIQYLQQLQQSMIQQPGLHDMPPQSQRQQVVVPQKPSSTMGTSVQSKQQKVSQQGQGPLSKQGLKTKAKRRTGSVPATLQAPSYMSAEMPWSSLSTQTQQIAAQSALSLYQCNNTDTHLLANIQPVSTSNTFYRRPAPCGNPEPLYEYLASPTVVPGLEIIGHDYYGNYVQILPICPETTCSMNQDPVYLNLLQAIYAHTIPFLDLAPGSEEETQRVLNGTPSAITTQSIQPPFKNLLPLNGPMGTGVQVTLSKQTTLTTSISSPTFQQSLGNSKISRRVSMASTDSTSTLGSRRSSTASNPSNPAKKKKNVSRTHPYKTTSVFKEDNAMVTEAILTQVGGLGGIGSNTTVSATDPRHKITEKMVHMGDTEYAAHYSKHYQSMNKSASTAALCLTSMWSNSQNCINPSSLMSSVSAPSITNVTMNSAAGSTISSLESIATADFIKALSECSGGMSDLELGSGESVAAVPDVKFEPNDLASLENLMLMESNADVQATASTAWPNWFDLSQLEKDICQEGITYQASAFSSASCSMGDLSLSNSTTLASFAGNISRDSTSTNLLLDSSTHLAMMDDFLTDHQRGSSSLPLSSQDSKMNFAVPESGAYHQNSTSQKPPAFVTSQRALLPRQQDLERLQNPSKSVASQGLSEITGVDYTTTCWYDVEQLQTVVRDSISFQESSVLKSLEDLTEPNPPKERVSSLSLSLSLSSSASSSS
ncbi:hypothetical protein BGZ65_005396 [Modicella reniformis]|uniref:Uncharacterized protein n=1 Tax=Modicella reniformis TaxID=1440133 RepID=A0A9P6IN15_9FUNG|nr:hypothetical protein BGZ65_005396 [Modicella reniformis]